MSVETNTPDFDSITEAMPDVKAQGDKISEEHNASKRDLYGDFGRWAGKGIFRLSQEARGLAERWRVKNQTGTDEDFLGERRGKLSWQTKLALGGVALGVIGVGLRAVGQGHLTEGLLPDFIGSDHHTDHLGDALSGADVPSVDAPEAHDIPGVSEESFGGVDKLGSSHSIDSHGASHPVGSESMHSHLQEHVNPHDAGSVKLEYNQHVSGGGLQINAEGIDARHVEGAPTHIAITGKDGETQFFELHDGKLTVEPGSKLDHLLESGRVEVRAGTLEANGSTFESNATVTTHGKPMETIGDLDARGAEVDKSASVIDLPDDNTSGSHSGGTGSDSPRGGDVTAGHTGADTTGYGEVEDAILAKDSGPLALSSALGGAGVITAGVQARSYFMERRHEHQQDEIIAAKREGRVAKLLGADGKFHDVPLRRGESASVFKRDGRTIRVRVERPSADGGAFFARIDSKGRAVREVQDKSGKYMSLEPIDERIRAARTELWEQEYEKDYLRYVGDTQEGEWKPEVKEGYDPSERKMVQYVVLPSGRQFVVLPGETIKDFVPRATDGRASEERIIVETARGNEERERLNSVFMRENVIIPAPEDWQPVYGGDENGRFLVLPGSDEVLYIPEGYNLVGATPVSETSPPTLVLKNDEGDEKTYQPYDKSLWPSHDTAPDPDPNPADAGDAAKAAADQSPIHGAKAAGSPADDNETDEMKVPAGSTGSAETDKASKTESEPQDKYDRFGLATDWRAPENDLAFNGVSFNVPTRDGMGHFHLPKGHYYRGYLPPGPTTEPAVILHDTSRPEEILQVRLFDKRFYTGPQPRATS